MKCPRAKKKMRLSTSLTMIALFGRVWMTCSASIGMTAVSFSSVRDFLDYQRLPGPSCLILDVRMPVQTGTEFFGQMAGLGIDMPVIFITGHGDIAMGVKAMRDGAVDFLSKPFRGA